MNYKIPSPIISKRRFIGRKDKLAIIKSAIEDLGKLRVICITGEGGIGKTSILRETENRFNNDSNIITGIIDLFDGSANTPQGFMERFLGALPTQFIGLFSPYREERLRAEAIQSGAIAGIEQAWVKVNKIFTQCVNSLSEYHRLIILIDTIECASDNLGQWVSEWFESLTNCAVIMAGRPNSLCSDYLSSRIQARLTYIQILPFSLNEAKELWLEEVPDASKRIEELEKLWILSEGLPILFILSIDKSWPRFIPEGTSPPKEQTLTIQKCTLKVLENLSVEDLDLLKIEFKKEIIMGLLNLIEMSPEAIALCYMAQIYKLFTPELFTYLEGIDKRESEEALSRIDPWTFIKHNPWSKSYHLHDVIRELICEIAWPILDEGLGIRKKMLKGTIKFYRDQLKIIDQEKKKIAEGLRFYNQDDQAIQSVITLNIKAGIFQSHQVYYQILENVEEGLRLFHSLYDYNLWVKSTDILEHLQRERDIALAEIGQEYPKYLVDFDHAKYLIVIRRDFDAGNALLTKLENILSNVGLSDGIKADIALYKGIAFNFNGAYALAEKKLTKAANLFSLIKSKLPSKDLRSNELARSLARTYENMGYGYTRAGRLNEAVVSLKKALLYSKEGQIDFERAFQLNELGNVYACLGEFERGRFICKEGLKLREKMLFEYPLALSYNTMGSIEYWTDSPGAGRRYCQQALEIFERIRDKRGIGLSHRAIGGIMARIGFRDNSLHDLEIAEKHLLSAIDIFMEGGKVKEPAFMAETYERMGLMYNGFRNLKSSINADDSNIEKYFQNSRFSYQRCIMEYSRAGSALMEALSIGKLSELYIDSERVEEASLELYKMENVICNELYLEFPIHYSSALFNGIKNNRHEMLLPLGNLFRLKTRIQWSQFQTSYKTIDRNAILGECGIYTTSAYVSLINYSDSVFEYRRLMSELSRYYSALSRSLRHEFTKHIRAATKEYPDINFKELNNRIDDINIFLD